MERFVELLSISITGYKRFRERASLQTNGKLVALLGPNEAGKSSLLAAIAHLAHNESFSALEISRNLDPDNLLLEGRFYLDQGDIAAAGLAQPSWLTIYKRHTGKRTYLVHPPAPKRNVTHRSVFDAKTLAMMHDSKLRYIFDDDAQLYGDIEDLRHEIETADETIQSAILTRVAELQSRVEQLFDESEPEALRVAMDEWSNLLTLERAPTPAANAIQKLSGRIPEFLIFDDHARDLKSNYSITNLRGDVPPALSNLLDAAELSLPSLFEAIDSGLTAKITQFERRASRTIGAKFKSVWKQSGIEVAIGIQGDVLEVQIVNSDEEHTPFAERSDGLRQFVALQMFATRSQTKSPILLIDEAEQRLHYDAQADLVQMLAKQQVAPKVIYTTHSAGCLPEDLGNGVRTIQAIESNDTSRIINRFWGEDDRGIVPLLFRMGASTMAFFPTRHAVVVEGPSDMLLYPTLFREALNTDNLGFQFVPGLSSAGPAVNGTTKGVLFLVDGDGGGESLAGQLSESGVDENHIIVLRNKSATAVELEDFVAPNILLDAANTILERFHPNASVIAPQSLQKAARMSSLETAFLSASGVALPKVDLAYCLLDMVSADPSVRLLDPRRSQTIEELAKKITTHFENIKAGHSNASD